jgi:ABC-type protease/lipase transport system fused ATPase/permease subunit
LDEPNAHLDTDGEAALLSALQTMRERGCAQIVITHKTNILEIVDKIMVLAAGQVQAYGTRDEIMSKLLGS